MSTRSTDGYNWSKWEWDHNRGKFYRYRYNSKNKQVWDSKEAEYTPRLPIPTTSSSIAGFSSSTTDNNPEYYDDYQYGQSQSDPVGGLIQGMARTNLGGRTRSPAASYTGYGAGPSSSQASYQVAAQYQSAQPTDIPGASSYRQPANFQERSMYSAADRMNNYTASSPSNFSSAPTGYDVPQASSSYYDAPIMEDERDYVDDDPYDDQNSRSRDSPCQSSSLSRSYSSEVTVTQANSRSREPPPPMKVPKDLAGLSATRPMIGGTAGTHEPLNPDFKVHVSRYFKPGHIFKVVWSEPKGETRSDSGSISGRTNVTEEDITPRGAFGQQVHSCVRRFVVVATGVGFSNCVPILTYGRQGLNKSGITRKYHAVIYSSESPPTQEFTPDLQPIQFEGKNARHKLDPYSLVNYAKIYPVEHNVKVQFIGWIAKNSQRYFVRDFDYVWNSHKQMPR